MFTHSQHTDSFPKKKKLQSKKPTPPFTFLFHLLLLWCFFLLSHYYFHGGFEAFFSLHCSCSNSLSLCFRCRVDFAKAQAFANREFGEFPVVYMECYCATLPVERPQMGLKKWYFFGLYWPLFASMDQSFSIQRPLFAPHFSSTPICKSVRGTT